MMFHRLFCNCCRSLYLTVAAIATISVATTAAVASPPKVGAFYFEGWYHDTPEARGAFVTDQLYYDFPDRRATYMNELWRADTVEAMEKQIDLAADAGISFFTFNWYWNGAVEPTLGNGMNSGLANFLQASNNHRMEFSIQVNNDSVTPIAQNEWHEVVDLLTPYFNHDRHVKVGGKPLLNIFNPVDPHIPFDYIQQAAQAAGLDGVALTSDARGAADRFDNIALYAAMPGYEVGEAVAYPYKNLTYLMDGVAPRESDTWADPGLWNSQSANIVPGEQAFIPTVMSGFDTRPWPHVDPSWYFNNPEYYIDGENWGRTPENFAAHFQNAIDWLDANPHLATDERIIMIYAWNEFGEGGYIAPTLGDPDGAYLQALRNVIPEPSALVLVSTGALILLRRRHRRPGAPVEPPAV
ncbi:glycoside hydrolase family 99-like domain-containing protein [Phycisphaerales bacterium AB-hyl4]|uniref:Glycoside hydrolase family 99-like domain-containing protein n=1 Tax=Natronomicrosphaera hydrolytica TaxID=3242702 RepID=A0ABV4U9R1_9BACT